MFKVKEAAGDRVGIGLADRSVAAHGDMHVVVRSPLGSINGDVGLLFGATCATNTSNTNTRE